mgnify:CR=1|jgi:hypothetical protein
MTAQSKIRSLLYDQSKGKSASEQEELLQKIRYIVLTEGLPFNWVRQMLIDVRQFLANIVIHHASHC